MHIKQACAVPGVSVSSFAALVHQTVDVVISGRRRSEPVIEYVLMF